MAHLMRSKDRSVPKCQVFLTVSVSLARLVGLPACSLVRELVRLSCHPLRRPEVFFLVLVDSCQWRSGEHG